MTAETSNASKMLEVFCVYFVWWYILLQMYVCFCCVRFSFSILSQEIGWEEMMT